MAVKSRVGRSATEIALFIKFLCQIEKKVVGSAQKLRVSRGALNTAIFFFGLIICFYPMVLLSFSAFIVYIGGSSSSSSLNDSFTRSQGVRQSNRARAISSLIQATSSVIRQPVRVSKK